METATTVQSKPSLAVLIDADNVSPSLVKDIFRAVCALGSPIIRRAYGMVNCFTNPDGWLKVQHEYGVVSRPQVSNVAGKNVADIALVIDAMELLYTSPCDGICIVSGDSDFTALAARIREGGKAVYGLGRKRTPESFRAACTKFVILPDMQVKTAKPKTGISSRCPRCGGELEAAWTKSKRSCRSCPKCGGMVSKVGVLKSTFAEESVAGILKQAKAHQQAGCVCPDCGASMSLVRVAVGKRTVEIDVCGHCQTVWYDQNEFEAIVPTDGLLHPNVSAGKAYRRELVLSVSADLRAKRHKPANLGALMGLLKNVYHAPHPDLKPIVSALMSERIIKVDKSGKVDICT